MVSRETLLRQGLDRLGFDALAPAVVGRLSRFTAILEERALPAGFVGPDEAPRLIDRHVLDSVALARHVPPGPSVDVGSGAGLPGVVLSIVRSGRMTLIESHARRGRFLREVAQELDLDVAVVIARSEEAARRADLRERAASAVARALGSPDVALELTMPFVRPGGRVALLVGRSALDDGRAGRAAELLGGEPPRLEATEVPGSDGSRCVMIVDKCGQTPDRYPRRPGVPAKRPLGVARGSAGAQPR